MAEEGTGLSEDAGKLGLVRPYVVLVAEISGLFTIFFSLCSALLNSLALAQFGVDFLSIATPSDLLMSGLRILVFSLQEVAQIALLAIPLYFVLRLAALSQIARIAAVAGLAVALLILVHELVFELLNDGYPIFFPDNYHPAIARNILLAFLAVPSAYAFHLFRNGNAAKWIAAIGFLFLAQVTWETYWINWSPDGFDYLLVQEGDACPYQVYAIWIGTDSVVGHCGDLDIDSTDGVERYTMIHPREDVTIVSANLAESPVLPEASPEQDAAQ